MAFGFPAHHEDEVTHKGITANALRDCITEVVDELSWGADEDEDLWLGSTGLTLWSYGETVTIERHAGGRITMRSECKLVTHCFDFGRNKRNVEEFFYRLRKCVEDVSDSDD
jgi:hypothetical protein